MEADTEQQHRNDSMLVVQVENEIQQNAEETTIKISPPVIKLSSTSINFKTNDDETRSRNPIRLRYWTLGEDIQLVELWRRYRVELEKMERKPTVYQKITHSMRQQGFVVKPQECKRRIAVLKSLYYGEKSKGKKTTKEESKDNNKSSWKLWPLVDVFMRNDTETTPYPPPNVDLFHELNVVTDAVNQYAPVITPTPSMPVDPHINTAQIQGVTISQKRSHAARLPCTKFNNDNINTNEPITLRASISAIFKVLKYEITTDGLKQLRDENRQLTHSRNEAIRMLRQERDELQQLQKIYDDCLASLQQQQREACQ